VSSVPPQPQPRQHDSGVIADAFVAHGFPKICRDIGSGADNEAPSPEPIRRNYKDVLIGFISGIPSGASFVVDETLNATVREHHLGQPANVAKVIKTQFLENDIPVSIILHKNAICDSVLAVFDNLVNSHERGDLVSLLVIAPVNVFPSFERWAKARDSAGSAKGNVQIFQKGTENVEQRPQRSA